MVSIRALSGGESNPGGWFYRLQVKKVYRGPTRKTIEVFTENASGRFPLEKGKSYLLFASKSEKAYLEIANCGNSAELTQAGPAMRELEQLLRNRESAKGGDIGGRVILSSQRDMGVAGVRVVARGGSKSYAAVTDKDGWFHVRVPAGKYEVSGESPDWVITAYDLSYDDPHKVIVQRGGCAEVALLVTRK